MKESHLSHPLPLAPFPIHFLQGKTRIRTRGDLHQDALQSLHERAELVLYYYYCVPSIPCLQLVRHRRLDEHHCFILPCRQALDEKLIVMWSFLNHFQPPLYFKKDVIVLITDQRLVKLQALYLSLLLLSRIFFLCTSPFEPSAKRATLAHG